MPGIQRFLLLYNCNSFHRSFDDCASRRVTSAVVEAIYNSISYIDNTFNHFFQSKVSDDLLICIIAMMELIFAHNFWNSHTLGQVALYLMYDI